MSAPALATSIDDAEALARRAVACDFIFHSTGERPHSHRERPEGRLGPAHFGEGFPPVLATEAGR